MYTVFWGRKWSQNTCAPTLHTKYNVVHYTTWCSSKPIKKIAGK